MADKVKATEAEIQEALTLLAKVKQQRAKQKERFKNDPALQAKMRAKGVRNRIAMLLTLKKAAAAGIVVSAGEIDAEIAKRKAASK
ncbi:MAG: hypothetical protein DDT22_01301 [candidate division WS2 bacterium]|nr:hypothetical protein [Candidatus Lithacetigena glycinireducens]